MRRIELFKKIEKIMNDKNHSFLSYSSMQEESIKLALKCLNENKKIIIIKENNYLASKFRDYLLSYFEEDEIACYLPEESMRAEEIASSFENRADRIYALYQIINNENIKVIVTSPYGYIRHLPNKDVLRENIITIKKSESLNKEELLNKLKILGYDKTSHVETPMTYASRGYIVDVYSVNNDLPIRIEFFDDEVDSIRTFDINTQRTVEILDECQIIFAKDVFFNEENKKYLKENIEVLSGEMEINLEYLYNDIYTPNQYFYYSYFSNQHLGDYVEDASIYISNEDKTFEHLRMFVEENTNYIREMHEENKLPLKFSTYGDLNRLLVNKDIVRGNPFGEISKISEVDLPYGNIEYILTLLTQERSKYKVVILEEKEIQDFINACVKQDIKYSMYTEGEFKEGINIICGYFYGGFEIEELSLSIYSNKEIFKQRKRVGRFANRYAEAVSINSYEELNTGDYVVHDQYGIGQYVAIETRNIGGIDLDYLKIIYKGNDELLVPLSQFSLVRKYVSKEGSVPKLHKLGSKEWSETKRRVEENVDEIAERLLNLYTSRESNIGFAFSKDSSLQNEFEDKFKFELTHDQVKAVEEVKADMEIPKPMDRLLCGDVGFGKTEVALRAAFKAANDNKQTAYLCPTTVLSLQHYQTFIDRLSDFPVRVELLNRYVAKDKQREIIEDLKNGRIDILIGTHRILSKDIEYKDLGLLIIDEEQRFGVEHKEKIKELKNSIDVLSLSATPIPRTLQMSLIGIRGLSTLNTPPLNRYPVQTYVVTKNDNLIDEVIMRELERNGQVFYLFNNVSLIYSVARKLQEKLPYAKVDVAHGKMSSEEIEDVMYRFYNNEINVLLCTTIIETGIDIPNANTIIVNDAHKFGLSQLYQIKGRVGRSDRVAYAYFMIPEKKSLSETSVKRLEAIKEFTSLGSGYKIAMRDLTIRGAGDLLGAKQSGFIDNVGLDLYLSLLSKAIKKKKGEEVKEEEKEIINIPLSSYIPEGFSDNDYEKLQLYHELDNIKDKEELLNYYLRVVDEYGRLPKEVESLFNKKKLELLINLKHIDRIVNRNGKFVITLTKNYSDNIDGLRLFEYCNKLSKDIKISYKMSKLVLAIDNQKENIEKMLKLIDNLENLQKDEN